RSPKGRFLRSGLGSRINEHRELLHILHPPGDETPTDQEGMTQWQIRAGFASGCRPHHHDRLRWRDIVAGGKRIDAGCCKMLLHHYGRLSEGEPATHRELPYAHAFV